MLFFAFNILVVMLCIADFCIMQRTHLSSAASCVLSIFWVLFGLSFSLVIYWIFGIEKTYEYLSAYFIEKTLSLDNLFVFYYIFSFFNVSLNSQPKLLFIGIFSAIFFRLIMIYATFAIISKFSWVIYPLGLFLIYCGLTTFLDKDRKNYHINEWIDKIKNVFKNISIAHPHSNLEFFCINKKDGKYTITITTYVLAIFAIEISDILFAVDSIPAVFSVTNNEIIAYTSNILAILGLRSLYHFFAITVDRLYYFKHAVSLVMVIVGGKMLLSHFINIQPLHSLCLFSIIFFAAFLMSSFYKRDVQ